MYFVINIFCRIQLFIFLQLFILLFSMEGEDLCYEIVKRASAGFVYSEAVARRVLPILYIVCITLYIIYCIIISKQFLNLEFIL